MKEERKIIGNRLRGKTYIELYGKEMALLKRQKQSNFMKKYNPMHTHKINFSGKNNPNYRGEK